MQIGIDWAHFRYGVWLPDAAPEVALSRSQIPALLMAGTADNNVPMHHAQELESACGSRCALWIVPGAGHGGISTVTGAAFGQRVLQWFEQHDPSGAAPPFQRAHEDARGSGPGTAGLAWARGRKLFHMTQ